MVIYLIIVAILSVVILGVMLSNYRKVVASGLPERFRFIRVVVSWVMIFTFIGSIGGAIYASVHHNSATHTTAKSSTKESATSSSIMDKMGVKVSPKDLTLDSNGELKVTLTVSSRTSVQIIGHNTKEVYATFSANKSDEKETFDHTFKNDGQYDIVLSRGGKTETKLITVNPAADTSSSDSSYATDDSASDSSTTSTGSSYSGTGASTGKSYSGSTYYGNSGTSGGSTTSDSDSSADNSDTGTNSAGTDSSATTDSTQYGNDGGDSH